MKAIERLYEYFELKSIKPTAFEKAIGLSNGYLGTQKKRNADMGEAVILNIVNNCRDLSLNWLLTGQGSMLQDIEAISMPKPVAICIEDSQEGIPLIPFDAIAGFNTIDNSGISLAECEHYIIPSFSECGAEFLVRVSGSSMLPKYYGGDILGCRKLKDQTFFQWGKIYVIDSTQGVLVKRIEESDEEGCITCVSDNPKYPPFSMPMADIRSLSIVVGVVRLE